jgi:hypothetical protein
VIAALRALPRGAVLGAVAVVVLYLGTAVAAVLIVPWAGSADSGYHMVYIQAVWNGTLPPMGNPVAAHPPSYYWFLSLFVGGLVEDHRITAVIIVRLFNVGIGAITALVVYVIAWRLAAGRWRVPLAVTASAIAVLMVPYIRVAADVYNDAVATLWATIALGLAIELLRRRPTVLLVAGLTAVNVLGMSTRATFVATLGLSLVALGVSFLVHATHWSVVRRLLAGAALAAAIAVLSVLPMAWFYERNRAETGSWFRARVSQPFGGRDYQSLTDNLTNLEYWFVSVGRLLGFRQWDGLLPINFVVSFLVAGICLIGVLWFFLVGRRARLRALVADRGRLLVGLLFVLQVLAVYAMQLQHATGWGNINMRYLLPALLVFAVAYGLGANAWPRLRGALATAVIAILALGSLIDAIWYSSRKDGWVARGDLAGNLVDALQHNQVPVAIIALPMLLMAVGLAGVVVALRRSSVPADGIESTADRAASPAR